MHSAKILAETKMNQHSGKILATIAFQIPVPANTNIYATPQTYATSRTYIDLAWPQKVHVHVVGEGEQHKDSFPLTYLSKKGNLTT